MSKVLLGRAIRRVGAAATALVLLCSAGPVLAKSSVGIPPEATGLSGSLPLVPALAARARGSIRPLAIAAHACAGATTSVSRASAAELRSAVICLINRIRSRGGLPWLHEQGELDSAAQGHTDSMVYERFFGHGGIPGSSPSLRISAAGFRWGAWGEAISTGYRTPRRVVLGWLSSTEHCRILLSPSYRYIGVGVNPSPIAGWATWPGTWTADLALPLGSGAPSGNWGPADRCPY